MNRYTDPFTHDRTYIDTVRRRDYWTTTMFVLPEARFPGSDDIWLALDSNPDGTHIRVDMTPEKMRTLGEHCIRIADEALRGEEQP
jgi:cell wall assembly regulator SMI1